MSETTLSRQLDKTYMLAVKHNLFEAAEFLKTLIVKYDIIKTKTVKNNKERKRK